MIRLAGLSVDWQEDRQEFVRAFVTESDSDPVMKLSFSDKLSECHSVQYADCASDHFLRGSFGDILLANGDWSEAVSYCLPKSDKDYALTLAALCSRFAYFNTLLVHSSLIIYQGKGLIFTGRSGIGKTTQAELWSKYKSAEIVNGDKAFIREVDSKFFAYGLPWKGSSEYCLNKDAELVGIVVLEQSDENRISILKNPVERLLQHAFFPHWDKNCLEKALDTFDSLIDSIPVYLLECRPDEEAVRMTHDEIFG